MAQRDAIEDVWGLESYEPPSSGEWVRRRRDVAPVHECPVPMATLGDPPLVTPPFPDGDPGDLWRCGCGRLWRVVEAIPGRFNRPAGRWSLRWGPAPWWVRLREEFR
jgi:hypothetical protein